MDKQVYTCPMHPEIMKDKPGKCPKCHMNLMPKDEKSHEAVSHAENQTGNNYTPLFVIIGLIFLVVVVIGLRDFSNNTFSFFRFIANFMAGFFVVFAGFKLMDIKGFAQGYSMYDLLAKRIFSYGYVYPFIELFFGLAMIAGMESAPLLLAEVAVMGFSGIGVLIKIMKKERFQCACLGTFLKVPLTNITLVEDFGMAALGIILLLLLP